MLRPSIDTTDPKNDVTKKLEWAYKNTPEQLDQVDNEGRNIAHLTACSGNPEALQWVHKHKPGLLEKLDNEGSNIAHFAAWSGNPEALQWVLDYKPELLGQTNNEGSNIAHYAAWSGNPETRQWVQDYKPELLDQTNNGGRNIAHFAAWSGNPRALQWVHENKPGLLDQIDNEGNSVAHFTACSGNPEALQWLLDNKPELLDRIDNEDGNIAHLAASSSNPKALQWVHKHKPGLLDQTDNEGNNIAHYATCCNNLAALQWIHENKPQLLDQTNKDGHNIAHSAAEFGHRETLTWIQSHNYKLFLPETPSPTIDSVIPEQDPQLKDQFQHWLAGTEPYLALDDIGEYASKIMRALDSQSPAQLISTLADVAALDRDAQQRLLTLPLTLNGESVCQRLQKSADQVSSDLTDNIANAIPNYLNITPKEVLQRELQNGSPAGLRTLLLNYSLDEIYGLLANEKGLPDVRQAPKEKQDAFTRVILQEAGLMFAFKGHMTPYFNPESDYDKPLSCAFRQLVSLSDKWSKKQLENFCNENDFKHGFSERDKFDHHFENCITLTFDSDRRVQRIQEFRESKAYQHFLSQRPLDIEAYSIANTR